MMPLTGNSPISPPFVRIPIENRSKYEKLIFNAGDISSDSDKDLSQERIKQKRKRVKNVLRRKKKVQNTKNTIYQEYNESNDSISLADNFKTINDNLYSHINYNNTIKSNGIGKSNEKSNIGNEDNMDEIEEDEKKKEREEDEEKKGIKEENKRMKEEEEKEEEVEDEKKEEDEEDEEDDDNDDDDNDDDDNDNVEDDEDDKDNDDIDDNNNDNDNENDKDKDNDDENDEKYKKKNEAISENIRIYSNSIQHSEKNIIINERDYKTKKSKKYYRGQRLSVIKAHRDPIVGHQYGEKPLLLDDELDSESKLEYFHGDPFIIDDQYHSNSQLLNKIDSLERNEKMKHLNNLLEKSEKDIFALAPFPRSSSYLKKSNDCQEKNEFKTVVPIIFNSRVSEESTNLKSKSLSKCNSYQKYTSVAKEKINVDFLEKNNQQSSIEITLIKTHRDFEKEKNIQDQKKIEMEEYMKDNGRVEEERLEIIRQEDKSEEKKEYRIGKKEEIEENEKENEKKEEMEEEENIEKDLFGSSPFSPNSFVVNSQFQQSSLASIRTLQSSSNIQQANIVSSSTKIISNSKFDNISASDKYSNTFTNVSKDLFGSVPFDEFTYLQLNEKEKCDLLKKKNEIPFIQPSSSRSVAQEPQLQSPSFRGSIGDNTLLLNKILSPDATTAIKSTSILQEVYTIKPVQHTARITVQTVNSVSKPDVIPDIVSPMSPEPLVVTDDHDVPRHKRDKFIKSEKSKYRLINENHNDVSDILSSSRLSHKTKSIGYSKKTSRIKKYSVVSTAAGFSNMSFEDFPSDENEEKQIRNTKIAPFEVIREPEKRFGSLKRKSNPFS